ncbi:MAG: hypothetical protein WAV22_06995 [Porticoccaceae bacterium]
MAPESAPGAPMELSPGQPPRQSPGQAPTQADAELAAAIRQARPAGEALLVAAAQALERLGLADQVRVPPWAQARFSQRNDPASGLPCLRADFCAVGTQHAGQLLFHGDGSHYGEFDICQPHPQRLGWWIEAVEVWGKAATVKSELRLLAMPGVDP